MNTSAIAKTLVIATAGVAVSVGATMVLVAPTASAVTSMGSCNLSGSGPAPSCSYQLVDDDLTVQIRSASSTSSTLNCAINGVGSLALGPGESGSVGVRNLSVGVHSYRVACSTPRGGAGGVSRAGTVRVSVAPQVVVPTRTTPTRPSLRKPPTRTVPSAPSARTQPTTTTTSSTPMAEGNGSPTTPNLPAE